MEPTTMEHLIFTSYIIFIASDTTAGLLSHNTDLIDRCTVGKEAGTRASAFGIDTDPSWYISA